MVLFLNNLNYKNATYSYYINLKLTGFILNALMIFLQGGM